MTLSRRHLLLAGTAGPLLASCATDLSRYQNDSVPTLATRLGVCQAVFARLKAGQALAPTAITGCSADAAGRADAVFQAASLTKPVVAWGALRLTRSGHLDLEAPISHYLRQGYTHYHSALRRSPGDPSDTVPIDTLARIPVATLLNHTSGLPNWTSNKLAAAFDPGSRWQYSGEGYVLLQAVIEAVTGMPISQFMDEQVFKPLGMRDSSLVWQDRFADQVVHGESATGVFKGIRFRFPVAAASLYTTAADYMQFVAALAADAEMVSLILSKPVEVDAALGLAWGYGWGIERTNNGLNLWQWGNNPGFRTFVMFSPSSKDGFVIFTNHEQGMPLAVALAHQTLPSSHNAFRFDMVG